jgi:hypothetical protein
VLTLLRRVCADVPPNWINWLSAVCSIAGFTITCWVLSEARTIRKSFILRGRLPGLLKALENSGKKLSNSLGTWPQEQNDSLIEFQRARSVLISIEAKLMRPDRVQCNDLAKKLGPRRSWFGKARVLRDLSSAEVWTLYTEILGVTEWLRQHERDLRWK